MLEGIPAGGGEPAGGMGRQPGLRSRDRGNGGGEHGAFGHDFKSLSVVLEPLVETCH